MSTLGDTFTKAIKRAQSESTGAPKPAPQDDDEDDKEKKKPIFQKVWQLLGYND